MHFDIKNFHKIITSLTKKVGQFSSERNEQDFFKEKENMIKANEIAEEFAIIIF